MTRLNKNRCKKCILPNTCKQIPFDDDGLCMLCKKAEIINSLNKEKQQGYENFLSEVDYIRKRGEGKPYDCVVGVSGGRDSTYLLYVLTQKHHLRCLAAYYQTPFTPDLIDDNIRKIVKNLGADLVEIKISKEYHKKIARQMVLLWAMKKNSIFINLACAPCKLVNCEIYKISKKFGVPTIVYGTNIYEAVQIAEGVPKDQVILDKTNDIYTLRKKVNKMFFIIKNGIKALISYPGLLKYLPLGIRSSLLYISPHTFFLTIRYPKITSYSYFYGSQWKEAECEKTLKNLGWEKPADCYSSWKADCYFAELKNYLFKKTIGITYGEAYLSNMVRAGIITREEALRRYEIEFRISEYRIKKAMEILDLDIKKLEKNKC